MTTPKAKLALIAALCAGFILVLTACTDERARTGAEFNAGVTTYEQGEYATAFREWRPLAEQGNANAQLMLGLMYDKGRGVPQDYVQAHMWFNLAASRFRPGAGRDKAVKNRDIAAERMTPAQIAKAKKLARKWKPKK